MNSNNHIEYEIIDSHTSPYPSNRNQDYSKYPYRNNPNQPLQNMNYKDWLNNCQMYNGNLENFALDWPSGISAVLNISGTLLSLNPISTPLGAGLIIASVLVPLFWPTSNNESVWSSIIDSVQNLIEQNLSSHVRNSALQELRGLEEIMNKYKGDLENWLCCTNPDQYPENCECKTGQYTCCCTNPNQCQCEPGQHLRCCNRNQCQDEQKLASTAIASLEAVHTFFLNRMPQFQEKNYEILLLPTFTQAANIHLMILRDFSIYGKKLGMSDYTLADRHIKQLDLIKQYTNYAIKWYREGLNKFSPSPCKLINWKSLNDYRRIMTLSVLDIISIFPIYDFKKYPSILIEASLPKLELTREIYTSPLNYNHRHLNESYMNQNLDFILTRRPHLFTWLHGYQFQSINPEKFLNLKFLSGYRHILSFTNRPREREEITHGTWGYPSNLPGYKEQIFGDNGIYQVLTKNYNEPDVTVLNEIHFMQTLTKQKFSFITGETPLRKFIETISEVPAKQNNTQNINNESPTYTNFSHILSYMTNYNNGTIVSTNAFAWTHNSVTKNNIISNETITIIPAVKAFQTSYNSIVDAGPGFTGGDLIRLQDSITLELTFPVGLYSYDVRIRYASNAPDALVVLLGSEPIQTIVKRTITRPVVSRLEYEDFQYAEFTAPFENRTFNTGDTTIIHLFGVPNNPAEYLWIDRIEFIPRTPQYLKTKEKEKIETIQQKINDIFLDPQHQYLKLKTTDYEIDQIANEIETILEEWYPQEKMMLLDEIKYAKQQNQSRNLLQNGDFTSLTGWRTTNDVTIQTGNPTFKEYALHMLGARTTEINHTVFPTYVYQKIEESKLKPYTRYIIRGYIENSKELELYMTRSYQEIHTIMNVPNDSIYMNNNKRTNVTTETTKYLTTPYIQHTSEYSCSCKSDTQSSTCQHSHTFSFTIDTGDLDFNQNLGIHLLFKISDPDGYATLGNVEIIEERLLIEEEIHYVKNQEQKWKEKQQKQQKETEQLYSQAQQMIQSLFKNKNMLQIETNLLDIIQAEQILNQVPNISSTWFSQELDNNDNLYTNLKQQISQAYLLYKNRNFIRNGDFREGTINWSISPDAIVEQINDTSVLVISNWSTQVSQQIQLQPNHRYLLRVIAKKEGNGTGYVKISDCTNQIETLTFIATDSYSNQMTYITKTIPIMPQTDQVRIDIGETEGTFKISSIELICMYS